MWRTPTADVLERKTMNVTVEDLNSVKKVMHLEIPAADVTRELDKAYNEIRRTARIKGFRQGKAPRNVIERLYKKEVHADVAGRLIQETLLEALKDSQLPILGTPKVDPPELAADAAYKFDAVFEIKPEIADIPFKGLTLKKTDYKVSEGEIEAQLGMLQRNLAARKPVEEDRPVQEGDFVIVDYAGFWQGKPYQEAAPTEDFTVKVGDGTIHKDFDAQLVGRKAGEQLEINVDFPGDCFNPKLAGKSILFQVTIKEIRIEELPPIDDAMAQKLGPYQDLAQLTEAIRGNLASGYTKRAEQELNEQIFKALIERTDFDLPETLVEHELNAIIEDAERSFSYQNMTFEQVGLTRERFQERYRPTAEHQVRRHLILDKIIRQESLDLSDEAIDAGMAQIAQSYNQPLEGIKAYYSQNPERLDGFKHALLEKEAIKLIMDNSQIELVEPQSDPVPDSQ